LESSPFFYLISYLSPEYQFKCHFLSKVVLDPQEGHKPYSKHS
jgi:hypothetical protein